MRPRETTFHLNILWIKREVVLGILKTLEHVSFYIDCWMLLKQTAWVAGKTNTLTLRKTKVKGRQRERCSCWVGPGVLLCLSEILWAHLSIENTQLNICCMWLKNQVSPHQSFSTCQLVCGQRVTHADLGFSKTRHLQKAQTSSYKR